MENSTPAATTSEPKKHGSLGRAAVIVGIVIVLNLFFNYAISLVYKAPAYEDYYQNTQVVKQYTTQADCVAAGGQWTDAYPAQESPTGTGIAPTKPATITGYCDSNYTHMKDYAAAQKDYDRNVFIVLVVLGVISLVMGGVLANPILTVAFSWGGVLSLFIASVRYWSDASGIVRVLVLAAALGALVWVAVRKFGSK